MIIIEKVFFVKLKICLGGQSSEKNWSDSKKKLSCSAELWNKLSFSTGVLRDRFKIEIQVTYGFWVLKLWLTLGRDIHWLFRVFEKSLKSIFLDIGIVFDPFQIFRFFFRFVRFTPLISNSLKPSLDSWLKYFRFKLTNPGLVGSFPLLPWNISFIFLFWFQVCSVCQIFLRGSLLDSVEKNRPKNKVPKWVSINIFWYNTGD